MHLTSLSLSNFRNYDGLTLRDLPSGAIGFAGANGAGKTNILEAISLLSPGRGLRHADARDIGSRENPDAAWAVHGKITGKYGDQDIGTGIDLSTGRRQYRLNGAVAKSQADLGEVFSTVWLTPAHDRVFMDGASGRRKLLDRWVFTADPAHAGRITRMDRLLSERNRLLSSDRADPLWLDALENDLAATAVAVASARIDYLERLTVQINAHATPLFPVPDVRLSGEIERQIGQIPARVIEQDYRALLKQNRGRDKAAEATTIGPHRSDLVTLYAAKNMPAAETSTGEQKALLFSLFMAHVRLLTRERGEAPVLLLDEMTAHLDPERRAYLMDHLLGLGAQVLLTAVSLDQIPNHPDMTIYNVDQARVFAPTILRKVSQ